MGVFLPKIVMTSAAALLALSSTIGRAATLDLRDELALQRPAGTATADTGSLLDEDQLQAVAESLTLPVDSLAAAAPAKPATDMSGIDLADFNNSVYALALRNEKGLGLGLASSGGLALTGGFATKDGMQVNVYLVHRINEIYNAAREIGIEDLPSRTLGVTVGWKF